MEFSVFNDGNQPLKYSDKIIKNKIKVIRLLLKVNPRSRKIEKLKLQIFMMSKNIVIKNINNYIKYTRNSAVREISNNHIEMESEAFIVCVNCIDKFKLKYDFCFYFNKALSRNFFRMFEREKKMFEKDLVYKDLYYHSKKDDYLECELEIDIYNFGLTGEDMIVLRSKLNGETKDMFNENNPTFQMSHYYNCFKKIKTILITLKENDDI